MTQPSKPLRMAFVAIVISEVRFRCALTFLPCHANHDGGLGARLGGDSVTVAAPAIAALWAPIV